MTWKGVGSMNQMTEEAHQPGLPGMTPHLAGRRREPRQRKGESWKSYAFRHETWRRVTFPGVELNDDNAPYRVAWRKRRLAKLEVEREMYRRGVEVWCYRQIELAKKNLMSNGKTTVCVWPVFFWFGKNVGVPGSCCQYINQAALDYMIKRGVLAIGNQFPARMSKPGKRAVSFGSCLGGS